MSRTISVDTKELARLIVGTKHFEKEVRGALASALNRTVDHVNTKIGRIVTGEYALKTAQVKKTIKVYKAKKGDLNASLKSTGPTLALTEFPHKPESLVIARSIGVRSAKARPKVKVKKGKMAAVNVDPNAFLAKIKGEISIVKRTGKSRKPIHVLRSLSVPQMIGNEKVEEVIQATAQKKFDERLTHDVNYRLDKLQKTIKGG
jgi:hypothetical protein